MLLTSELFETVSTYGTSPFELFTEGKKYFLLIIAIFSSSETLMFDD
jgi:hypothetical protein